MSAHGDGAATAESTQSNAESDLQSLIRTFQSEVKTTDWLKENTAERWEKENPELATEYKNAIKMSQKPSKEQSKTESGDERNPGS